FVPGTGVYYRVTGPSRLSSIGNSDKRKETMVISMKLHIDYLLSLEDSKRTREACVNYMQNWYHNFHPERPDLVAELQAVANRLQGRLEMPRLRWKYAWIKPIFGWKVAKWAQCVLPQIKSSWFRYCDRVMYLFAGG